MTLANNCDQKEQPTPFTNDTTPTLLPVIDHKPSVPSLAVEGVSFRPTSHVPSASDVCVLQRAPKTECIPQPASTPASATATALLSANEIASTSAPARLTPCKRSASDMLDIGKASNHPKPDDAAGRAIDSDDVDMQPDMPQHDMPPQPNSSPPRGSDDDSLTGTGAQTTAASAAAVVGTFVGTFVNTTGDSHLHAHASHALERHMAMQEVQRDGVLVASVQDEEMSTAQQQLYDVTIESPSSPGGAYKRMRSSADSDAGSSSCKDMDEPEVPAPDSVPALVAQLRQLVDYVGSKPSLHNGSASFMRDYLRTMLIQNSLAAEEAIQTTSKMHKAEVVAGRMKLNECFRRIPDELAKHIFSFLEGRHLALVREVCRRWDDFACDEQLWKTLCLKRWRSLDTDQEIWKLIDRKLDPTGPNPWRSIYPKVKKTSQWKCRLQKTGRFICNLVAHQISGAPLAEEGLPNILVVERRFNILHLQTFVLPEASVLYYEPEEESDRAGFDEFIDYLHKRTRAGLALEDQRRFIFIPPCDYTRNQVNYQGSSLLGVVQNAYPPLAP